MADERNSAAAARQDNGRAPRKVSKKATSKRRVLNASKDLSAICSFKKENSPSKPTTSIRERTVIGQEASPKRAPSDDPQVSQETFKSAVEFSENIRSEAEGSEDGSVPDVEAEELSKLRCTSERTEVIAEREKRKRQRCADYPGLAFGSSIFSSDTLMKFSVIRNELHNILNSQLKRVSTTINVPEVTMCQSLIEYSTLLLFRQRRLQLTSNIRHFSVRNQRRILRVLSFVNLFACGMRFLMFGM